MSDRYIGVVIEVESSHVGGEKLQHIRETILLNRYVACAIPVEDKIYVSFKSNYRADDMELTITSFKNNAGVKSVTPETFTLSHGLYSSHEYDLEKQLSHTISTFCGDKKDLMRNRIAVEIGSEIFNMFSNRRNPK